MQREHGLFSSHASFFPRQAEHAFGIRRFFATGSFSILKDGRSSGRHIQTRVSLARRSRFVSPPWSKRRRCWPPCQEPFLSVLLREDNASSVQTIIRQTMVVTAQEYIFSY